MLKIQEFINCFGTIKEANEYLQKNLNIESITNTVYEKDNTYKIILYKPMLHADMTNPLVREAHCLLLDDNNDVMAKAWNHPTIINNPQELSAKFSFGKDSTAEEIPDGDIIIIYNIEGKWCIGSSGDAFGKDNLPELNLAGDTYANHVIKHLEKKHIKWSNPFKNINPMLCFVLYYVHRATSKVMPIERTQLYLTSIVNLENGSELSAGLVRSIASGFQIEFPNIHEIYGSSSLTKRLHGMRTLAPGLMLRDCLGNRIVIPNPIYTSVKNALDAGYRVRPVHMAKIVQVVRDKSDLDVIVNTYPDTKAMLNLLWNTRIELWQELLELWNTAKHVKDNMREFAIAVQHHPLNYILFKVKDLKVDICAEVEQLKPTKLEKFAREKHQKEFDSSTRLLTFLGGNNNVGKEDEKGITPYCQEGD